MLEAIKNFLLGEDGGAIEWVITIIAGVLIVVAAYIFLKGAPRDVGRELGEAGGRAGGALDRLKLPPTQ